MARKRKTLPKDFGDLLKTASLDELTAVFGKCELDARGGYSKQTAIGFWDCPDDLIVWLVEQGLDVDAADNYRRTPLWERASLHNTKAAAQIPLLISLGANIEAPDTYGQTPLSAAVGRHNPDAVRLLLEHGARADVLDQRGKPLLLRGLIQTRNADIEDMVEVAKLLLAHGVTITDEMRTEVERIGRDFEFHRGNSNPDYLGPTDVALGELYRLFDVTPVAARQTHDGVSPIVVPDGSWPDQHEALWQLLVPSSGAAETMQGEAIRATGRIANEIFGNGGANWDRQYRAMLDTFLGFLGQGTPLDDAERADAATAAKQVRTGDADPEELNRLSELAVEWVKCNPAPIPLGEVPYKR